MTRELDQQTCGTNAYLCILKVEVCLIVEVVTRAPELIPTVRAQALREHALTIRITFKHFDYQKNTITLSL